MWVAESAVIFGRQKLRRMGSIVLSCPKCPATLKSGSDLRVRCVPPASAMGTPSSSVVVVALCLMFVVLDPMFVALDPVTFSPSSYWLSFENASFMNSSFHCIAG